MPRSHTRSFANCSRSPCLRIVSRQRRPFYKHFGAGWWKCEQCNAGTGQNRIAETSITITSSCTISIPSTVESHSRCRCIKKATRRLICFSGSSIACLTVCTQSFAISKSTIEEAIRSVRGSKKVTSKSAESSFEALSKYATDLTALAEQGKA